jgi:hypothetical protein
VCPTHRPAVRRDGSGFVSADVVVRSIAVDRRPADLEPYEAESASSTTNVSSNEHDYGSSATRGFDPGRLRPPHPPGPCRSCIALGHAQGVSRADVRREQDVRAWGLGDVACRTHVREGQDVLAWGSGN